MTTGPAPGSEPSAATEVHACAQPTWRCTACEQPWPCPPARQALADQFGTDRVGLSVYMGEMLAPAARDIRLSPGELWDRFIDWTR
ncbi:hypothetical protein ACI2K4_10280 [Micromonospora sp. NPDC050397]|uniref:hypothetical protein n=1 Tax=Micromonospora sp. NPDC050397 TaxID=3364279 RepID=UPI00384C9150